MNVVGSLITFEAIEVVCDLMTTAQALAFVKRHGIVLESARGPVPSLAAKVAGEPIRGGWWSHPKGKEIFRLSRAIRESPGVLVCRIVGGKVTYVHRRLWPALVLLAARFSRKSLAAIKELHTPAGKHKLVVTPFPDWVPKEVLRAARQLKEPQAAAKLAVILGEGKKL
jgi:hypothetical protein